MTVTQIHQATNVSVPAAPPTFFYPSSTGLTISANALGYQVITDSPAYAGGSSATIGIETQIAGTWTTFTTITGYTLGSYVSDDTGLATTVNEFTVMLSSDIPAHSHLRIRVESVPAGTLATLTVNRIT